MARITKAELEEMVKVKDNLIDTLIKRNIELENEIEHLKTQINIRCNLGRKEKFSDDEKATIQMLRLANNSYRAIAKQMGCSVGTVHKIIKELEQE